MGFEVRWNPVIRRLGELLKQTDVIIFYSNVSEERTGSMYRGRMSLLAVSFTSCSTLRIEAELVRSH